MAIGDEILYELMAFLTIPHVHYAPDPVWMTVRTCFVFRKFWGSSKSLSLYFLISNKYFSSSIQFPKFLTLSAWAKEMQQISSAKLYDNFNVFFPFSFVSTERLLCLLIGEGISWFFRRRTGSRVWCV